MLGARHALKPYRSVLCLYYVRSRRLDGFVFAPSLSLFFRAIFPSPSSLLRHADPIAILAFLAGMLGFRLAGLAALLRCQAIPAVFGEFFGSIEVTPAGITTFAIAVGFMCGRHRTSAPKSCNYDAVVFGATPA